MMSTPVQRALHCLALLLAVALATSAASRAAVPAAPYEINAILSLTGGGAFLGKSEAQAILLIQDYVNKTGGIKGRPIKFTILDDASSPQIAVQLAGPILAHNVPVIVGPDLTALCSAITPLIEKSGPLVYCISPGINPPANSYMFSGSVSLRADAVALVRFFRERHWTRMAMITSTDATGQSFEEAYNRALALPENKFVDSVDIEHFANSDLSVAGQVSRLKAANPQAVIAWTTGTSFATLLRGFHDGGYVGPIGGGNGNMIYAQLTQYTDFMPKQMYFPGQRALAEGTAAGPVHDAQAIYLKAFAAAGVQHPDWGDMAAWDPTMVTIDALRHVGLDATPEQVRAYVLNLHSWAGISGIYDFRDGLQRGIGIESVVIDQWVPARGHLTAASKSGGMPLP